VPRIFRNAMDAVSIYPAAMEPITHRWNFKLPSVILLSLLAAGLSFGAACTTGTIADYQALGAGGCTLAVGSNTVLFSNFSFFQAASGPTSGGSASQISLVPLGTANTVGFDIIPIGTFSAGATGVNDIDLTFVASIVGGANLITGLNASVTGSAGASNVGGGTAGADVLLENFCRGGSLPPGSCPAGQGGTLVDQLSITGPAAGTTVTHSNVFAATNALSILKDLQLNGNNGATASSVTDFRNVVVLATSVPEPSTSLGVGTALLGLGLFLGMRRRGSQG
jgi:hypothetical protein